VSEETQVGHTDGKEKETGPRFNDHPVNTVQ